MISLTRYLGNENHHPMGMWGMGHENKLKVKVKTNNQIHFLLFTFFKGDLDAIMLRIITAIASFQRISSKHRVKVSAVITISKPELPTLPTRELFRPAILIIFPADALHTRLEWLLFLSNQ